MNEKNEIEKGPKLTIEQAQEVGMADATAQSSQQSAGTNVLKEALTKTRANAEGKIKKETATKAEPKIAANAQQRPQQDNGKSAHDSEDDESEATPSLQEIIREQATEDEAPMSKSFTLRKILGGDILTTQVMRRQIWLFLLITFFVIIYISNRYSCQQNLIEIDKLQKELKDAKYKALSSSSQLTEKTRESRVLELLQVNKDSVLKIPSQPPYVIQVQE